MTLNVAKHYLGFFKDRMNEFKNKFESLYLELSYFYTDFDEAVNGRVYYDLISRVQPMWMQKAIIIANELDKIEFGTEEIYANLFFIK
jgi:hypothetical protein